MNSLEKYLSSFILILVVLALAFVVALSTLFSLMLLHDVAYPECEHVMIHHFKT